MNCRQLLINGRISSVRNSIIKEKEPIDYLTDARFLMMTHYKFWAFLALQLNFIEEEGGGGAGTTSVDGDGNFYYDPDFVKSLSTQDMAFVMAHEIMHIIQSCIQRYHSIPGDKKSFKAWNIAADYVTDTQLVNDTQLKMPESRKNFITEEVIEFCTDKVIEEVYRELMKENNKLPNPKGGPGNGDCCSATKIAEGKGKGGRNKEPGQGLTAKQKHDWTQRIISAAQQTSKAEGQGSIPGFIKNYVAKITNPTVSWRDQIRHTATSKFKSKYTFARPSRRGHTMGVRLQSRKPAKEGAVLMFDTSGSISNKELNQAASEAMGILKTSGAAFVHVFFHDVNCYFEGRFTKKNISQMKVTKGGTSHIDVFKKVNETLENIGMVVAFTDLETTFPAEKPDYPVIWCHAKGRGNREAPWGKKVEMILNPT